MRSRPQSRNRPSRHLLAPKQTLGSSFEPCGRKLRLRGAFRAEWKAGQPLAKNEEGEGSRVNAYWGGYTGLRRTLFCVPE